MNLNEHYAVVLIGGKAAIMHFANDDFELMSKSDFLLYLGKHEDQGRIWLKSEDRRTYGGIVFEPGKDAPGYYNLFRGFPLKPAAGACQKFLAHIEQNVCHGNKDDYRWFMAWWASVFQHPEQKVQSCVAVVGDQGTGKSFVAQTFKMLLGQYALTVSTPGHIVGQFNEHHKDLLLMHAEEAFWADDKKAEGRLKDMITSPTHIIEGKFQKPYEVSNYMRLFVTSNDLRPVPADVDARRFAIWHISNANKGDHAYFKAIQDELDNAGGYEALMDYLMTFDLTGINLRQVPKTDALLNAKIEGLDDMHSWLLDILSSGKLPNGEYTNMDANECPASVLFEHYIQHAKDTSPKRKRSIETTLGKWLRKTITGIRPQYVTARMGFDDDRSKQTNVYAFPPLAECRKAFAEALNQDVPSSFWNRVSKWGGDTLPPTLTASDKEVPSFIGQFMDTMRPKLAAR